MKTIAILAFVAVANAKPQGYNYQAAQQHFNVAHQQHFSVAPQPQYNVAQQAPAAVQPNNFNVAPQASAATAQFVAQPSSLAYAQQLTQQQPPVFSPAPANTALAQNAVQNAHAGQASGPNGRHLATVQTLVSKHFYLHSAPEEDLSEESALLPAPVRKHYRVLFIKSPTSGNLAGLLKAAKPKDEEKTVIYVLNKKTDVSEFKNALDAQQQPPTKPEVFFIKYKTPEEALHAQHEIQAQYDALGGTSEVSDEGLAPVQSFVGSVPQQANNQYLPPTY